jgi:DNA-3-methyladenine glycosylase
MLGGTIYTYLCYGMHVLFNIVTGPINDPQAVLIRAIKPMYGINQMLVRRSLTKEKKRFTGGPALVTQALGITIDDNKKTLTQDQIWIHLPKRAIPSSSIIQSKRVGVAYAQEDADLPYRFRVKESQWTSLAN